jgi:hypothetical protein
MAEVEIHRHFAAIRAALGPGETFLYVFQGPRLIPGHEGIDAQPVRNWKELDGKFILSEKRLRDGHRDEYCIVIETLVGEIVEYREQQKAMAYADVLSDLRGAGFAGVEAYRDFDRSPASADAFHILVCRR